MTGDELEKMLVGFGKSTKSGQEDTVGQYGVGFKSGASTRFLTVVRLSSLYSRQYAHRQRCTGFDERKEDEVCWPFIPDVAS